MLTRSAVVVGAGLTGAAAAWRLRKRGVRVRVYERAAVVGGHVRTEWHDGVPYEPNGAHIFHTCDRAIWALVTGLVPFVPYRHRVLINVCGELLSWPLQLDQLTALPEHDTITRELAARPARPRGDNFEQWCVSLLGPTLYAACVHGYTLKQWGTDPTLLAATIAAHRIELRDDGYLDLFRDPYQGWPRDGYVPLVDALLDGVEMHLGADVTLARISEITRPGEPVIVTSALDDFLGEPDRLAWRGVRLEPQFLPQVTLAQPAMVINEPGPDVAWTRTIETKWARPDLHHRPGTIVMREFPGHDAKHYPVDDAAGANRKTQADLRARVEGWARNPVRPAGRLGTYGYINMDEAIRSGLSAADEL